MLQAKVSLHSIVDVITNSSTEIFINVNSNTVKVFKKFIEKILTASGIKKSADDLFDFEFNVNGYYYDDENDEDVEINETFPMSDFNKKYHYYNDIADEWGAQFNYNLILKLKDGSKIDLTNQVQSMFDIFDWSNG